MGGDLQPHSTLCIFPTHSYGCKAGRLARQNVTAERSRLGAISFHPTLPRVLVEPNSEQSIPRAVITLLFCLRCNPPVLVRGRRVRRLIEKHFMHVPRYGIPQTNLLATSHSPRLLGRPQKHVVKPSLASFSRTRHTGPSRSFPALHTSSRPGLSWVVPTLQPGSPRLSGDSKTLGHRHNNLSIQALNLTPRE